MVRRLYRSVTLKNEKHEIITLHHRCYPDHRMGDRHICLCGRRFNTRTIGYRYHLPDIGFPEKRYDRSLKMIGDKLGEKTRSVSGRVLFFNSGSNTWLMQIQMVPLFGSISVHKKEPSVSINVPFSPATGQVIAYSVVDRILPERQSNR